MKTVSITSPNNKIIYSDTEDHFENGFLRLMKMSREKFDEWLALSESFGSMMPFNIANGFSRLFCSKSPPGNFPIDNGPNGEHGKLKHFSIAENPDFGIAISKDNEIGWLVQLKEDRYVRVTEPPIYEESYFEGDLSAGGYADYAAQETWRLEKSNRQVKEMIEITGLQSGYVLDLGSGYGYFRKALDDAGFKHEGIEISRHANAVSNKLYGFNSYDGILSDHLDKFTNSFDVVVLSDVIEHVADPIAFLKEINMVLKPGGFVIIKTPNLDCPEEIMFLNYYHSFKREHLVYFTNNSLLDYASQAGLDPFKSISVSHLLVGFAGKEKTNKWASELKGADLIVYVRKPCSA